MKIEEISAVVYDVETCDFTYEDNGIDVTTQTLTIAVTCDDKNKFHTWKEEDVDHLIQYLLSFDKIIGFNIKAFDNKVLDSYNPGVGKKLDAKSIDMMEFVEKKLGHRVSLENLVSSTLNAKKSGNGALAVQWALEGDFDKIADYCTEDVKLTRDLFIYGLKHEEVIYDHYGDKRKIKVDWLNPSKKTPPTEFNYVLMDEENGREIKLDPNNKEFFQALEVVRLGKQNIFITGKAGTGKTTFLKYVKANIPKNTVIVAYTGVAAINAGGQTIHSFFNISPQEPPFTPWDNRLRTKKDANDKDDTTIYSHFRYTNPKRQILKSLELLIIDEVSMVRSDFLDVIDKILRAFGRNRSQPFGGVQVLLIGDTFQLPPIEGQEWNILGQFYESPFFFSSEVFKEFSPLQIELKTVYRQNEIEFIELLNRIRVNKPTNQDLELLNNKVRPITNKDFDENYIVLSSTNYQVNQINQARLSALASEELVFEGRITGKFPQSACATDVQLKLKEGAQVMFLKNGAGYFNGKIGTVVSLEDAEIMVQIKDMRGIPSVVKVEKHTWENVVFSFNSNTRKIEREVVGTFTQYPLKLAWAITVHKSQGLTFEKVAIDINDFAPSGLTYVALSRCTSLAGLALKQPLQRKAINTDPRVIEYAQKVAPETLITEILNSGKADLFYGKARESIREGRITHAYKLFLLAMKYRNDMETDVFRRYILYLLVGRKFYKGLSDQFSYQLSELRFQSSMKITELMDALAIIQRKAKDKEQEASLLAKTNATLLKEKSVLKQETTSLRNEAEVLNKKVHTLTLDNQQLAETNSKMTKKLETSEKASTNYYNQVKRLRTSIEVLQEKLEAQEQECKRLRKITWLQKLIGKK